MPGCLRCCYLSKGVEHQLLAVRAALLLQGVTVPGPGELEVQAEVEEDVAVCVVGGGLLVVVVVEGVVILHDPEQQLVQQQARPHPALTLISALTAGTRAHCHYSCKGVNEISRNQLFREDSCTISLFC